MLPSEIDVDSGFPSWSPSELTSTCKVDVPGPIAVKDMLARVNAPCAWSVKRSDGRSNDISNNSTDPLFAVELVMLPSPRTSS